MQPATDRAGREILERRGDPFITCLREQVGHEFASSEPTRTIRRWVDDRALGRRNDDREQRSRHAESPILMARIVTIQI